MIRVFTVYVFPDKMNRIQSQRPAYTAFSKFNSMTKRL